MNEVRKGKLYGFLFFLFLLFLVVGGYYLTIEIINEDNKETLYTKNTEEEEEQLDLELLKINKEKDYFYFENIDSKSLEHEIIFQDIIINLNSSEATNISNNLNSKMAELTKTFKKISEKEIIPEDEEKMLYKEDDIYSTTFRKYNTYTYKNYASLLIEEYDYDCFNGSTYKTSEAYVFDVTSGKTLTKSELLEKFSLDLENIKIKIKTELEEDQTLVDNVELIDIEETLKNLDNEEAYALYISKNGFLTISFLVKTSQVDYNDVIILN